MSMLIPYFFIFEFCLNNELGISLNSPFLSLNTGDPFGFLLMASGWIFSSGQELGEIVVDARHTEVRLTLEGLAQVVDMV